MLDTDAEELSYILQILKDNLEKFPTWVNENGDQSLDRFYVIGIYLTKHQTELMLNILENHNI